MKIVHISDTHGPKYHNKLIIPECDVLIHSGDIGGRTSLQELNEFLIWFEKQPAKKKIWIAGNHDIVLDTDYLDRQAHYGTIGEPVKQLLIKSSKELINSFDCVYLNNSGFEYEGIKFWGSPITPSFHRAYWAFNADRGQEIKAYWDKIPLDTNVLITHGPPHGKLDLIPEEFKQSPEEDVHRGCEELTKKIESLPNLMLHCFGHIHEGPTATVIEHREGKSSVIYSNAAVLDNRYRIVYTTPSIITI